MTDDASLGHRHHPPEAKVSLGKAEGAIRDMGSEAESTGKEMAASFSEPGDVLDGLQELTANAFAGLGPAGVVAGAAAAAGIGVIADTWGKVDEATQAAKESAYDYAFAVVESGSITAAADAVKNYTSDIEKMKNAQDIAAVSGWEVKDVVNALATGDGLPALTKAFDDGANSTLVTVGRVNELQGALTGTTQGLEAGATGAELYGDMLYDLATKSGTATGEVDDLGNAIYELPGGKEVVVDALTRQAHENLDALEQERLSDKTLRVNVDTNAAWAALNRLRTPISVDMRVKPRGTMEWQ